MDDPLPATMRAAFLLRPGAVELREVPVPAPPPGGVLVRVEAALTCGTDLKMYRRGHARLPLPAPFGHEFAGVIAAVGDGVTDFTVGDAVMCVPTAPCGVCAHCAAGRANLCAGAVGRMVLGAYADFVMVPPHIVAQHLFRRPRQLSAAAAAVLEPLACVVHGAARVDWDRARRVVVVGDGAIALLFARLAVLRSADSVLLLGRHEGRVAVAAGYGADGVVAATDEAARAAVAEHGGAQLVVECVGTPETWRLASELADAGGTVLLFGGCAADTDACFDAFRLHYEEVSLIGAFHYTPQAVRESLRLLERGTVDPLPLITHTLPLARLDDALELGLRREAIKVALVP